MTHISRDFIEVWSSVATFLSLFVSGVALLSIGAGDTSIAGHHMPLSSNTYVVWTRRSALLMLLIGFIVLRFSGWVFAAPIFWVTGPLLLVTSIRRIEKPGRALLTNKGASRWQRAFRK
jgi:hypothetical protein